MSGLALTSAVQPRTRAKNSVAASGSRVISSFQVKAPGSVTLVAPAKARDCQTEKGVPDGSRNTAVRPASSTSSGALSTLPPATSTLRAVSSTSGTAAYHVHAGGWSAENSGPTAATGSSPRWKIV
jgi:hypothetical protein